MLMFTLLLLQSGMVKVGTKLGDNRKEKELRFGGGGK